MRDKVTSKDSIHTMAHVAVHGNLVFAAIFLYNLATTAVNNEHPWNYSGNNDAICAQLKIDKPKEFDSYALCQVSTP